MMLPLQAPPHRPKNHFHVPSPLPPLRGHGAPVPGHGAMVPRCPPSSPHPRPPPSPAPSPTQGPRRGAVPALQARAGHGGDRGRGPRDQSLTGRGSPRRGAREWGGGLGEQKRGLGVGQVVFLASSWLTGFGKVSLEPKLSAPNSLPNLGGWGAGRPAGREREDGQWRLWAHKIKVQEGVCYRLPPPGFKGGLGS